MSEVTEELLEVDEEKLKYRVEYIKENLLQMSTKLRGEIPENLTDQDLTEDNVFRNWIVVNSIYEIDKELKKYVFSPEGITGDGPENEGI